MKIANVNQVKPISMNENKPQIEKQEVVVNTADTVEKTKDVSDSTNLPADKSLNSDLLDKSIEQANKSLKQYHRVIERNVHEVTKAVMYTVKDTDTNEVIAEFPPKKIQDMIAKMWELAGLVVDEKA